jgi:hypothetical protein
MEYVRRDHWWHLGTDRHLLHWAWVMILLTDCRQKQLEEHGNVARCNGGPSGTGFDEE